MRSKSKIETDEELEARITRKAKMAADSEAALDAMVRKSIKLHGA